MRAEWRDPEDTSPDARKSARIIQGYRRFCPLRRMLANTASGITEQHVMAADKLRELADLATLGYTGPRLLLFVLHSAGPVTGLGPAALARNAAWRALRRAMRLFSPTQLAMLDAIVLGNQTLRAWTLARGEGAHPNVEKGRLLAILDTLAHHFETELANDIAAGRRQPP
jgi:hypothetical protein